MTIFKLMVKHIVFLLAIKTTESNLRGGSKTKESVPLKIAFCLTGQLARLELWSKLTNIIVPNVRAGHTVHLFMLLDNQIEQVKQTFWRYDYRYFLFKHK